MSKIKLKKKHILYKKNIFIYTIISIIIVLFFAFRYINKKITPLYLDIAENEIEKISNILINDSLNSETIDSISIAKLFYAKKNNKGEITAIDFDTVKVNKYIYSITSKLERNLKYIETGDISKIKNYNNLFSSYKKDNLKKGIVCKIPLGNIFNNTILSNLGGSIPVRLNLINNIVSNIKIKTKNYGINNTLVEVYAEIKLSMEVILPYTKEKTTIKSKIPIGIKMIQGSIPNYYSNSSIPITVPIE